MYTRKTASWNAVEPVPGDVRREALVFWFSRATEQDFTDACSQMAGDKALEATNLFRRWRFAHRRTCDERGSVCVAGWRKAAAAAATELTTLLIQHPPLICSPYIIREIKALRALAITAARRGAIQ